MPPLSFFSAGGRGAPCLLAFSLAWAQPAAAEEPLGTRTQMTGDWGGLRPHLEDRGVTIGLSWTGEVLGNASGGLQRGAVYDGLATGSVDIDLGKLAGWTGTSFRASGYWIQGRGPSSNYVGNLLTVSSIEADAGLMLNELFVEQSLLGDAVSVRLGQFTADSEFWLSDTASVFVNSTFGWPGINGTDLPGGGPAYPAATPGLRVRWASEAFSVKAAVFNGDPAGRNGDPHGLDFPVDDGVFVISEAAYTYAPDKGLGGTWKIGAWYNSERFDDLSVARNGRSLASPLAQGGSRQLPGDYSLYGIVDHQLWREPGSDGGGLSGFLRVGVTPQQDRNLITTYVDTGLAYTGLLPGRDSDIAGIGFAYAGISPDQSRLDRRQNRVSGVNGPVADFEAVIEGTYQIALTPAVSVQPFAQYVIHPGGNVANPDGRQPRRALGNAAVLGLRSALTF